MTHDYSIARGGCWFGSSFLAFGAVVIVAEAVMSRAGLASLVRVSWLTFIAEIVVATIGYVATLATLRVTLAWPPAWHVAAGVAAVVILGVSSVFAQGASFGLIALLSLGAGVALGVLSCVPELVAKKL
jgi:hypothetical protein